MQVSKLAPVVVVAALAACGGPQASEPAGATAQPAPAVTLDDDAARELADGMLDVLGTMAAIIEQRARECVADEAACETICVAIADDLAALFDRAEPLFELARAAEGDPDAQRRLTAALDRHADAVAPLEAKITPGLAACREEPRLVEVMERMPVL